MEETDETRLTLLPRLTKQTTILELYLNDTINDEKELIQAVGRLVDFTVETPPDFTKISIILKIISKRVHEVFDNRLTVLNKFN